MKIHQLPDGARFEYKGEVFIKTGPMFGTGPNGAQLIPRSAVLRPLSESGASSATPDDRIAKATVERAFDAFSTDCRTLIPEVQRTEFELACERFLASINDEA